MPSEKMTVKKIAKLAGVSPATVSFVINDRDGVSNETREKVLSIIKATNYEPNASSLGLSLNKSFNIALIYHSDLASLFSDLFYNDIAHGLTDCLTTAGYNVVFTPTHYQSGAVIPTIIRRHDADGVVYFQDSNNSLLDHFDSIDLPCVLVDLHKNVEDHTHVSVDYEFSIASAMNYLASKGHQKIALLGSDTVPGYFIKCLSGYQKALSDNKLPIEPNWIQSGANDAVSSSKCLDKMLGGVNNPTAVVCTSDMSAIWGVRYVKQKGIAVPEKLSFIGIDDILLSSYVEPALTCVSFDKYNLGVRAGEILLDKIARVPVQSLIINDVKIIERESVYNVIS